MDNISKIKAKIKIHHEPVMQHASRDLYGRMSIQNIVLKELKDQGREQHFKQIYAVLHHMLSDNKYRLLRSGNTLFMIKILGKNSCHLQIMNADPVHKMYRNILEFSNAIKKANYTKLYFETKNQKLIDFLTHSGHAVRHIQNDKYMVEA